MRARDRVLKKLCFQKNDVARLDERVYPRSIDNLHLRQVNIQRRIKRLEAMPRKASEQAPTSRGGHGGPIGAQAPENQLIQERARFETSGGS